MHTSQSDKVEAEAKFKSALEAYSQLIEATTMKM